MSFGNTLVLMPAGVNTQSDIQTENGKRLVAYYTYQFPKIIVM